MHIQFQLAQQCIQISTRINSSSVHTYIFICFTLRVILQGFVDPIMQHGVRSGMYLHLFNKENIWSNPRAVSCIQSSHPDKNNNSVDRIISKEEEREDPRRDSSIYLRVQWCFHIPTRFLRIQCILQCFYMQSSSSK